MEKLRRLFLKNFRKLLFVCIFLTCLLYINCLPISSNEIIETLENSFCYIGFSFLTYFYAYINCFTGAYEVFGKMPFIRYHIFMILGAVFVIVFISGFYIAIKTRKIEVFSFTIPTLLGAYIGGKTVDYINKKMEDN